MNLKKTIAAAVLGIMLAAPFMGFGPQVLAANTQQNPPQMHSGQQPNWNFQGVVYGRNGSEQRMNYRGCVPDGNIDLQGASVGDIIKRAWNMVVNDPPELQKLLAA